MEEKKGRELIGSAWSYRAQIEILFPLHVKGLKGVAQFRGKLNQASVYDHYISQNSIVDLIMWK
jgi:hypothetical protein